MIKEIKIPDIGENVESGQVVKVLVSVGDKIEKDQAIIELETDKAVVEIPAPQSGTIKEILVKEDDEITIGQAIAKMEVSGEEEGAGEVKAREKTGGKVEVREKEPEEEEETEPEEKAAAEETAEEKRKEEEEEKPAMDREAPEEEEKERAKVIKEKAKSSPEEKAAPASPSVRRLSRELGLDINEVKGTGPGGRITDDDVKNRARAIITGGEREKKIPDRPGLPPLPDFSRWGEIEKQDLSNVRRITAESVSTAWNIIPHVTQFDRADISNLEEFISRFSERVESKGGKLTITAPVMKVIAAALKKYPRFNASINLEEGTIIYKNYYHIGLAVATERGLLVPVIRDVDKKGILDLALEVADIADKTRNKKINPDQMEGGTFTLSNQGGIGGTDFTPIVFWPQAAILGISRASLQPVYENGKFRPRKVLPLSLSYDHRIVDGADAAAFLRWVSEAIENPYLLDFEE